MGYLLFIIALLPSSHGRIFCPCEQMFILTSDSDEAFFVMSTDKGVLIQQKKCNHHKDNPKLSSLFKRLTKLYSFTVWK